MTADTHASTQESDKTDEPDVVAAERTAHAIAADYAGRTREQGVRLAKRLYGPRVLALGLGAVCAAAVLYENRSPLAMWIALFVNCFVWPHIAYWRAVRSRDPYGAEVMNLLADSTAGGVWIALMAFNLLPSVMLVAMMSMDKISVGGARLLVRGVGLMIAGCAMTVMLFGLNVRPDTSNFVLLACLPLLVAYPIIVGVTTYRLARRVREQNRTLATLSRTDGLTGLLNRTHWLEVVSSELRRHWRTDAPVSLLILDIDNFKNVNDQFGHLVGDEALRNIAQIVRETLRDPDTPGRYGGEEFGVVLPDTNSEGACVIAERVRERIGKAIVARTPEVRCTVSIGVAEATPDLSDSRQWIERADRALYRAKALGRNRTVRHVGTASGETVIADLVEV
ncbi:MAG: diguanylate cyclase [Betaproteobacteria bacterium]|jgi:diguanylate cyclase|nr:diguanylate cyclase [Betaproteobacteria bacterium]